MIIKFVLFLMITSSYAFDVAVKVPAVKVKANMAEINDTFDLKTLVLSIDRQLVALKSRSLNEKILMGDDMFTLKDVKRSLIAIKDIVSKCRIDCNSIVNKFIKDNFLIYKLGSDSNTSDQSAHLTAYYSPTIATKFIKDDIFKYGIYPVPQNEKLKNKFSRNEILFNSSLEKEGQKALFYVSDPFELFLLQVEGGGRIHELLTDKYYFLSYADTNKMSFSFLGKSMVEKGYIEKSDLESQRKYLKTHPESWQDIYSICPNYVYFKITESEPLGMENIPLTTGRSAALDRKVFKMKGSLLLVNTKVPKMNGGTIIYEDFSRIFIDQDTGGAIKGNARADLYFGFGDHAKFMAENLSSKGDIYFLILK